jgi:hypothetical protein
MGNSKTTVTYAIYDGNYSTTPIAKIIRFMSAKLVQVRPFAAWLHTFFAHNGSGGVGGRRLVGVGSKKRLNKFYL